MFSRSVYQIGSAITQGRLRATREAVEAKVQCFAEKGAPFAVGDVVDSIRTVRGGDWHRLDRATKSQRVRAACGRAVDAGHLVKAKRGRGVAYRTTAANVVQRVHGLIDQAVDAAEKGQGFLRRLEYGGHTITVAGTVNAPERGPGCVVVSVTDDDAIDDCRRHLVTEIVYADTEIADTRKRAHRDFGTPYLD